jgi:hypothetical protein
MTMTQLFDWGLALVGLVLVITAAVFLGLWMKGGTRRSDPRGRR